MAREERTVLDDLERRIRDRGVRVDERLALLRIFTEPDAEAKLLARREELDKALRGASNKLKGTA